MSNIVRVSSAQVAMITGLVLVLSVPTQIAADPNMTILDEHRYADQQEREQRQRERADSTQDGSGNGWNGPTLGDAIFALFLGGVLCGTGVICPQDGK